MTTTRKQSATLSRIHETERPVKRTEMQPSGALVVYFTDRSFVVIERDGTVAK